jgi:hypothetical protein
MDWALITWGILIGMVGLLWIMVLGSVEDEATTPHVEEAKDKAQSSLEAGQSEEQCRRHAAA